MSKPYDYMVARMLLGSANKSESLEFTSVEHASGEVSEARRGNFDSVFFVSRPE